MLTNRFCLLRSMRLNLISRPKLTTHPKFSTQIDQNLGWNPHKFFWSVCLESISVFLWYSNIEHISHFLISTWVKCYGFEITQESFKYNRSLNNKVIFILNASYCVYLPFFLILHSTFFRMLSVHVHSKKSKTLTMKLPGSSRSF